MEYADQLIADLNLDGLTAVIWGVAAFAGTIAVIVVAKVIELVLDGESS